jgi:transposase
VSALPDLAASPAGKDGKNRMHENTRVVIGGVDAHADVHQAAALDAHGAMLEDLREQLAARKTIRAKAAICRRLRPDHSDLADPVQAAKLTLRSLAKRVQSLDEEVTTLDRELEQLVAAAAPHTTQLLGISTGHAGQLLVTAGQNIDRLRSDGAFAALCGASPIPASSGKTSRHRLNYGGDRDANRALHMIAVCRLRYCPRTRAYAERRTKEGKTKREIIRCLKRYIARETYRTLREDLAINT